MERARPLEHSYERFGPFIVVRAIGRGGMGEVYIARTPWEHSPVAAVKRLRPDVARIPTFADRFQHEAELAVRLDHDNVVRTIDVGKVNEQLYVASELVLGKDTGHIADRLRERGQGAPLAVVIRLLLDVLKGVAYVHGAREPDGTWMRLVHRDVTPGNVMVSYDGVAKLADFGLAKSALTKGSQLTAHGEILGTPHYLAPEIIRGEPASPASDIYGLGAVMYRVLTGVAPHQGTTAEVLIKALSERPRNIGDLRPDLPDWMIRFIHSMLDMDKELRPQDATLLARELTREAKKEGLLLPHGSVGRWLRALFEAERGEETDEYNRIVAIDPEEFPVNVQGTVVLAQALGNVHLEGPSGSHRQGSNATGSDIEALGRTADEDSPLNEDAEQLRRPSGLRRRRSGSGGPRGRRGTEPSGRLPGLDLDTGTIDAGNESYDRHELQGSDPDLPGFVDTGGGAPKDGNSGHTSPVSVPDGSDEQETNIFLASGSGRFEAALPPREDSDGTPAEESPLPEPEPRGETPRSLPRVQARRRTNPESVVVAPGPRSEPEIRRSRAQAKDIPRAPSLDRELAPEPSGLDQDSIDADESGVSMLSGDRQGSNLAVLPIVIWMVVAMVIGIGLGMYMRPGTSKPPTASQPADDLKTRYRAAVQTMANRRAGGQVVPQKADALANKAANALAFDDLQRATSLIAELETLLGTR